MNIQSRKLSLIEKFLKITDESIIEAIEIILKSDKELATNIKEMSLPEFYEMIEQAKEEKTNGRVMSHEDLKKEINLWK